MLIGCGVHTELVKNKVRLSVCHHSTSIDRFLCGCQGFTPLLLAAKKGHTAIVKYLILSGAWLGATTDSQSSALHFAAFYGHKHVVKCLIGAGIRLNAQESEGYTPLHFAAQAGHCGVVKILLGKADNKHFCHRPVDFERDVFS